MSEDPTPIPDSPAQDPDSPLDTEPTQGHGLSDSPHSGYEEEMAADGVGAPGEGHVTGDEVPPADLP